MIKKKRALPTPVRKAIANRFWILPTSANAPAATLSAKKSAKKKMKKRALATPIRKAIISRRVATLSAPNQATLKAPASAQKSSKKKKEKKKRALPTPLRSAISSRRVATPAAFRVRPSGACLGQKKCEETCKANSFHADPQGYS